MNRELRLCALLLVAALGCAVSRPRQQQGPDDMALGPTPGDPDAATVGNNGGDDGGGEFPNPPGGPGLPCPGAKQYLLILDFRSGWWTGGGGATFSSVVMPFLAGTCGGTRIEYHHYEAAQMGTPQTQWVCTWDGPKGSCSSGGFQDVLSSIIEQDWTAFTQFWILSGDREDPSDIGDGDMIYKLAVDKTADSCTPFLLGVGDGFITHGNVAANAIGLGGDVFAKDQPAGFFEYFGVGLAVTSRLTVGKELVADPLFNGVPDVADKLSIDFGIKSTQGDRLLANQLVTVIGHDTLGRPQIGVGRVPVANTPGRPFVLDAGLQRYYSLGLNDMNTGLFLRNIVKYLGSVGCKSGEPGWPS